MQVTDFLEVTTLKTKKATVTDGLVFLLLILLVELQ